MINLLILFFTTFSLLLFGEESPQLPFLRVSGTATVYRPADQFQFRAGVVTQGETALEALQENNKKMAQVIANLEGIGLTPQEYKTGHFSIQPLYKQRPQHAPNGWTPEIIGYEINNTLVITTSQIDQAGILIDSVTRAGANSVDSIQFVLKDPVQGRSEAIDRATRAALDDARSLSRAGGANLGQIFSLSINDESSSFRGAHFAKSMGAENVPIVVSGDIEISASVTVVFEIKSSHTRTQP